RASARPVPRSAAGARSSSCTRPTTRPCTARRMPSGARWRVRRAWGAARAARAVPRRGGGGVRGALVISSYVAHPGFSAADVELGQALARLASLAVETAQAYDERGAQARIDRASSELTAELAMARNSDGLRESLARVA